MWHCTVVWLQRQNGKVGLFAVFPWFKKFEQQEIFVFPFYYQNRLSLLFLLAPSVAFFSNGSAWSVSETVNRWQVSTPLLQLTSILPGRMCIVFVSSVVNELWWLFFHIGMRMTLMLGGVPNRHSHSGSGGQSGQRDHYNNGNLAHFRLRVLVNLSVYVNLNATNLFYNWFWPI